MRAERLEEIGIDFQILHPTSALVFPHIEPTQLRQVACRALNIINAEAYHPYEFFAGVNPEFFEGTRAEARLRDAGPL